MRKKSRQNNQNEGDQKQPKKHQTKEKQQKFSLYLLIEVERNATQDQIKKQYRKLVLKYHPDKSQDPNARQKFQKLKQAFDILSDHQKRKIYDQTGTLGDQQKFDEKSFQSAYQYFRSIFKKVTEEDLIDFEKKYRFGKMEQQDLLNFYQSNEGNMVQLIESIPLSTNQDIPRFISFFQNQIKENKIIKSKKFDKTKNKVRKLKDQTQQFEEFQKQKQKTNFNELALAIRQKNEHHQKDFLAALQEKYGGNNKKKTKIEDLPQKKKRQKKPKE